MFGIRVWAIEEKMQTLSSVKSKVLKPCVTRDSWLIECIWTCVFRILMKFSASFISAKGYADSHYCTGQCLVIWSCGEPRSFAAFRSSGRCARVVERSSCGKAEVLWIAGWSPDLSDSANYSCCPACREPSCFASCSLSWSYCQCVYLAVAGPELSEVFRRDPVDSSVLAWLWRRPTNEPRFYRWCTAGALWKVAAHCPNCPFRNSRVCEPWSATKRNCSVERLARTQQNLGTAGLNSEKVAKETPFEN